MITQKHDLDVTPSGVLPVINASQYDVGRIIKFYLYNDSEVYNIPVGTSVLVNGIKPNGDAFSYNATYTDNVVTVTLTEQMTVLDGEVRCEIRLIDEDTDIGTTNFTLLVEKAPIDSSTPISETEIPAIIELARAEQYNAEAWAVGQRNGVDVPDTDPAYHNNAKYWAEHTTSSLAGLSDVDINSPSEGQVLKYDATDDVWYNSSENAESLSGLSDTSISLPSAGQVLTYDDVSGKWVNGSAPSTVDELADLSDVTLTTLTDGQALVYDSINDEWVNEDIPDTDALVDLTDVALSTPTNGQVLKYNSTSQKWENANESGGGGSSSLSGLSDVNLSLLANNQIIKYNSTSQKWENVTLAKGDVELGNVDNTSDLNKPISTATQTALNAKASTTDVTNKHKVTSKQVATSGWSTDTTSQSGTTLYKKTIALSHVYVPSPTVDIGASGVLPTKAQQEAYDLLEYVTINGTTLTLYASAIPSTAFYINIEGVD